MVSSTPIPESVTLMSQYDSHSLENEQPGDVPTPIVRQKAVRPPFWLTKPALILFSSVFVACAATLITLDRVVEAKHGLPLTITSSEYSWTYGPTAILVIILSFWRRIDYYYKSIQPWKELQSGPTPASRSVLLDYVSPFQLQTMYKAFKMRHYQVTASILTFFILKGIILISTTLFVVPTNTHLATLDIIYQDVFNASNTWNTYWGVSYHSDRRIFTGGSDKYIWKYLARLNNAAANDSFWNANDGLVTQQFRPLTSSINITSLEAPVDVFVPRITCEEADLMVNLTGSKPGHPEYSWTSKTCSASGNEPSSLCPDHKPVGYGDSADVTVCGSRPVAYTLHRVNCSSGIKAPDDAFRGTWKAGLESYDIRYAITAAQYSVDLDIARKNASLGIKALDSTSIICQIGYGVVSANATHDMLSGNAMIENENLGEGNPLQNLTSSSLTEMILTGLHTVANVLVADKNVPFRADKDLDDFVHPKYDEALFQLMAVKMGQNYKPGVFLDPRVLENTSIAVIEGLMNEFARESLLVESRLPGTADGIVGEAKLQTRTAAVWLMAAGFCVLAIICLLLFFFVSTSPWVPAFCGSIAGHAAILVNSPRVLGLLNDTGHFTEKDLVERLEGTQFMAAKSTDGTFHIDMAGSILTKETTTGKQSPDIKPWTPIAGRFMFVILTLASPVIAIGVLELLQQLSDKRQGLLDMHKSDSTVLSYIVRIASTGAVFAIATMFNSFDFTTTTFAPYSSLRAGSGKADKTVLFHLLSVSPFLIIFRSLQVGHFGTAASNLASLLGSFLTIAVSGLWILSMPTIVQTQSPAVVTNWRTSWLNHATDDGGAAVALNLVRYGGANTSSGIWQDLVLPDVDYYTSNSDPVYQSSNYSYSVGALRPFLNCSVLPSANLASRMRDKEMRGPGEFAVHYETDITAHVLAPYECGNVKVNGKANISFGLSTNEVDSYNATTWVGQYFDLNTTAGASNADCPSVGILFGQAGGNETWTWNLTALVCSQGIEQIPVEVSYQGDPALRQINQDIPPKVARDEQWKWTNKTTSTTMGYKLSRFFTADLALFFGDNDKWYENTDEFDSFFNHIIYGPNGMGKEDIAGSSHEDTLVRLVERDYAEYMRIVIDLNFRASMNTSRDDLITADTSDEKHLSASTMISGTTSEYVARLSIHSTSKLIIQILLATMAVLGLVSYVLVSIDGTLPRNPSSIASTMAFLAGSQLCDCDSGVMPRGAEYLTDHQLKEVFDGWVFSLRWWRKEGVSVEDSTRDSVVGTPEDDGAPGALSAEDERAFQRFGIDVERDSAPISELNDTSVET